MKTNIHDVVPEAREAARIAVERIAEIASRAGNPERVLHLKFVRGATEGFVLTVDSEAAIVSASIPREFVAGVGKLLELLRAAPSGGDMPTGRWEDNPRFPIRFHYMPAHFGNSFEVAWPGEMQRYMEDMALWGTSGYGDWFDPNDMPDPYNPHVYCSSSMTLWQRKKDFMRRANTLGLDTMLGIAHNVGFLDQMRPEWVGVRSLKHRVQGQVLCPSIPAARAICLRNHENLFMDLVESGVRLNKLAYGAYDDGGCACDRCQPYFPTFLKMVAEIHEIARRYFPGIKADLCGWWVAEEEVRQLKAFIAGPAKEWFNTFQFSVAYEAWATPESSSALAGLPLSVFFHIGYSNDNRDVYLTNGIHSAPKRIRSVIQGFAGAGSQGFHTYNESFGDHYNQFLCTRLGRHPDADIHELTLDYVRQMYSLLGKDAEDMMAVLMEMEMLESEKSSGWAVELERLRPRVTVPVRQPWAFEHVVLKADLMSLDHQIGTGESWRNINDVEPFLSLIKKRLDLSEKLWRTVYGLGILRHIFVPAFMMPVWHKNYLKFYPERNGLIKLDFNRVSKNA